MAPMDSLVKGAKKVFGSGQYKMSGAAKKSVSKCCHYDVSKY
jgi:hypothetical protein